MARAVLALCSISGKTHPSNRKKEKRQLFTEKVCAVAFFVERKTT